MPDIYNINRIIVLPKIYHSENWHLSIYSSFTCVNINRDSKISKELWHGHTWRNEMCEVLRRRSILNFILL